MVIYGLALLSACMLVGVFVGELLGRAVGLSADIGGVGFAMLFLILVTNYLMSKNKLSDAAQQGIKFWSSMYIPIVIAMAASQNVVKAIDGGVVAILAGVLGVAIAFIFVPILSKMSTKGKEV